MKRIFINKFQINYIWGDNGNVIDTAQRLRCELTIFINCL